MGEVLQEMGIKGNGLCCVRCFLSLSMHSNAKELMIIIIGINGLLQRPGPNTLRRILGLLLFLPGHSAWESIYPGKPSHSSFPSSFLALVKGLSPPGGHWDSSAHLVEERWGAQAVQGHTPG